MRTYIKQVCSINGVDKQSDFSNDYSLGNESHPAVLNCGMAFVLSKYVIQHKTQGAIYHEKSVIL